jgi:hypothetical protein
MKERNEQRKDELEKQRVDQHKGIKQEKGSNERKK